MSSVNRSEVKSNLLEFNATGTHWRINFATETPIADIKQQVAKVITSFECVYSRFVSDSSVARLAKDGGLQKAVATELLDFYQELYSATAGRVTPAIGQQLIDAGYDRNYCLKPQRALQDAPNWLAHVSWTADSITTAVPLQLDVGAAGKGKLIDLVAEQLDGVAWTSINAGGDILVNQKRRIGLENPHDDQQVVGVVELAHAAICSSAPQRRDWGAYHHIIDPKRKESPRERVAATWVIAEHAMQADGLATALFLASPAQLRKHFAFEYAILTSENQLVTSRGFQVVMVDVKK